jgi:hypothetical protein
MCVRQMRPPGRGDFWILKIAHAPSRKNLSKNGFCPRKGVAFLLKALLQKNFQVRERILLSVLGSAHYGSAASGRGSARARWWVPIVLQQGTWAGARVNYAVNRPETILVPASRLSKTRSEGCPHVDLQPPARYRGQQMR